MTAMRVAIAGAGIGGLTHAAALLRCGIDAIGVIRVPRPIRYSR